MASDDEPTTHRARVDGRELHYLSWGAAGDPPVVLLHGGLAHAHWWAFVAPHVAARHHVLAPDLRGHGDSAHVVPPAYALDDYVGDLAALIEGWGCERIALVGHSLGGMIALAYAGRHPARVAALALVDCRPASGSGRAGLFSKLHLLPPTEYPDPETAVARFRVLPPGSDAHPDVVRHVARAGVRRAASGRWVLKFDRAAFARRYVTDLWPTLAALRCPTTIVRGGESSLLDRATLARMTAASPVAECAEIAGAFHHVPLDRPRELAAHLAEFLERHLARR